VPPKGGGNRKKDEEWGGLEEKKKKGWTKTDIAHPQPELVGGRKKKHRFLGVTEISKSSGGPIQPEPGARKTIKKVSAAPGPSSQNGGGKKGEIRKKKGEKSQFKLAARGLTATRGRKTPTKKSHRAGRKKRG